MKSAIVILVQAVSLAAALSPAEVAHANGVTRGDVTQAEAEALCGDLGVMDVPDGVDPYTVRACKEHPTTVLETNTSTLEKRKCWWGPPDVGCSKSHWCYKKCDNGGRGAWCWTTVGQSLGPWKGCGRDSDCYLGDPCSGGGCKKCGCGC